jgi:hypothetical protein
MAQDGPAFLGRLLAGLLPLSGPLAALALLGSAQDREDLLRFRGSLCHFFFHHLFFFGIESGKKNGIQDSPCLSSRNLHRVRVGFYYDGSVHLRSAAT